MPMRLKASEMAGGGNAGDMKIVKGGDGAGRDAVGYQASGKPFVTQQVPQQIDGHPAVAHHGYPAAAGYTCEAGYACEKEPQAFSR